MMINEILNAAYIIFSFLICINVWVLMGFGFIMLFNDFKDEIDFKESVLMCVVFPLTLMLMLSKYLHIKEINK